MRQTTTKHPSKGCRLLAALATIFMSVAGTAAAAAEAPVDDGLVVWTSPSKDSKGSMPIGNGDIGANVWVEPNGDLLFYISKTDSWSENCRLLKLGRVRISRSPAVYGLDAEFTQVLDMHKGEIVITCKQGTQEETLRFWIDANRPVLRIEGTSSEPTSWKVSLESWRDKERTIDHKTREIHSAYVCTWKRDLIVSPDIISQDEKNRIVWYHRNAVSHWKEILRKRGSAIETFGDRKDTLLGVTFGGSIKADHLESAAPTELLTQAALAQHVQITLLTAQTDTAKEWREQLDQVTEAVEETPLANARAQHQDWWNAFWSRSWIRISGDAQAEQVSLAYKCQRWINACGGRGPYPIKFNGSIFTVDGEDKGNWDADYRRWGPNYWWQNTRLIYWPMMVSGDYDLMKAFFGLYRDMLPVVQNQVKMSYDHGGAAYHEAVPFWGEATPKTNRDYYGTKIYSQSLELGEMALDYFAFTGDEAFLKETALPIIEAGLEFYRERFEIGEDGKRVINAASVETYWSAQNPAPDIAGLRSVLTGLLALPKKMVTTADQARWRSMLSTVPELPTRVVNGETILAPAAKYAKARNSENPELYAVFPSRLYGVGKPDLELAKRTYAHRKHRQIHGWQQDSIQAAMLGLTEDAARFVASNSSATAKGHRFPAIWGPNYDWIPDQCHGGVLLIAVQHMLLQYDHDTIQLLPAWPKHWNVDFKLHAPKQTVIEGRYLNGKLETMKVTPVERKDDVVSEREKNRMSTVPE